MAKQQAERSADDYVVTVDLGPNYEWVAEMQWPEGETQGGPGVLLIRPSNPDSYPAGGLSQTVLREVDFKYALERLRRSLANSKRWDRARRQSEEKLTALLVDHAGGGITPEYLALLSRVYIGVVNRGQDKPLEYLAEVTGKSAAAIKNHLWQATRKGLLERSPGRVGGHLTPEATKILERIVPGADALLSPLQSLEKATRVREGRGGER
ncbi:hypothetical protein [Mycobacterium avium]|uniref:hypothetical protein n=1 Tax=Mycobacterium avium TaxID=1764 RepID=UPI001F15D808|nr:hypothetical protein [Mycobacterium avium]